jgi:hypothetical protein
MAVTQQGSKYLTVMGFFPGNEVSNEFSMKFRLDLNRLLAMFPWIHTKT